MENTNTENHEEKPEEKSPFQFSFAFFILVICALIFFYLTKTRDRDTFLLSKDGVEVSTKSKTDNINGNSNALKTLEDLNYALSQSKSAQNRIDQSLKSTTTNYQNPKEQEERILSLIRKMEEVRKLENYRLMDSLNYYKGVYAKSEGKLYCDSLNIEIGILKSKIDSLDTQIISMVDATVEKEEKKQIKNISLSIILLIGFISSIFLLAYLISIKKEKLYGFPQ